AGRRRSSARSSSTCSMTSASAMEDLVMVVGSWELVVGSGSNKPQDARAPAQEPAAAANDNADAPNARPHGFAGGTPTRGVVLRDAELAVRQERGDDEEDEDAEFA